ncbi:hypothetical protein [Salipaludibacillus sp. CF4.18]
MHQKSYYSRKISLELMEKFSESTQKNVKKAGFRLAISLTLWVK